MKTVQATEAKNKFGEILDASQSEPVLIKKNGKNFSVLISQAEYQRLNSSSPVRPMIKELHRRSMERRRSVYEELAR